MWLASFISGNKVGLPMAACGLADYVCMFLKVSEQVKVKSTVGGSCCPLKIAFTFLDLRWEQILRHSQKFPSYSSLASGPLDMNRNQREKTGNWQDYSDWVCRVDTQMCSQIGAWPGVKLQGTEPGRCHGENNHLRSMISNYEAITKVVLSIL